MFRQAMARPRCKGTPDHADVDEAVVGTVEALASGRKIREKMRKLLKAPDADLKVTEHLVTRRCCTI